MMRLLGNTWRMSAVLTYMLMAQHALAQTDTLGDGTYRSAIEKAQGRPGEGASSLGESWDPDTGITTFRHVDLSLPGTGPTIVLARNYTNGEYKDVRLTPWTVGDWTLSIPRIETTATQPVSGTTSPGEYWVVEQPGSDKYKRCTKFGAPVNVFNMDTQWFGGFFLVDENGARQTVLRRDPSNPVMPTTAPFPGATSTYPAVTRKGWQIGCTATTTNGQSGEGFVAISTNGTKYYFTHLVHNSLLTLKEMDYGTGTVVRQGRMLATMYVTKIEDRFGNTVNYIYSGSKVTSIEASDGRKVTIAWRADAPVIDSFSVIDSQSGAALRTWSYGYDLTDPSFPLLNTVTNPDGSQWKFQGMSAFNMPTGLVMPVKCGVRTANSSTTPSATAVVTAPSGLIGSFGAGSVIRAYSGAQAGCYPLQEGSSELYESSVLFRSYRGLISKTLSGPGISSATWNYRYSTAQASTTTDACYSAGTCVSTHWAKEIAPTGNYVQYTYTNKQLDKREGLPLIVEAYSASDAKMKATEYLYASYNQGPWPQRVGGRPELDASMPNGVDTAESYIVPISKTTITQQGTSFAKTVNTFDAFARPLNVTKASSPVP